MTCPVCGTVTVPGARFCHDCGAALPAAATLPAAERRVVTVLFGDLSDFTAWAEDLDPERVGAVTDRVLAALAGAVKTFGGHVDKLTGDGIMAVFGAPVAHEDDAERAVRAALAMQRAVRRVLDDERGGGAPLGLRVGLNTGDVVAGIQAALEYTVIGDTVNTAARLADAAAVGAVYAGARTAAGTRHVASWRPLRPLRLKGKREPVEAYELLGLLRRAGHPVGPRRRGAVRRPGDRDGRVAGRLAEVDRPGRRRGCWCSPPRRASASPGSPPRWSGSPPATTSAPAGSRRAPAPGCSRCAVPRSGSGAGSRPLADLVRAAVGLPDRRVDRGRPAPAVEERLRRLASGSARYRSDAAADRHRPAARPARLRRTAGRPVASAGAEWADRRTTGAPTPSGAAAVAELLSGLAAEAPLVIIVDDLHDATAETSTRSA